MAKGARRILVVLIVVFGVALAAATAFSVRPAGTETAFAADWTPSGAGTQSNPYLVRSADDLNSLAAAVNSSVTYADYADKYYRIELSGDDKVITLSGAFTPIGSDMFPFNGYFDGNGVIIVGLQVDKEGDYAGLFGYVGQTGVIARTGVFEGSVTGVNCVGGIAGYSLGSVSECFFYGDVGGEQYVGGIAGKNAGTIENAGKIENCFTKGTAEATATDLYLGGITGYNEGFVRYCYSQTDVEMRSTGGAASYIGGVTGATANPYSITNSYYNTVTEPVYKAVGNDGDGYDVDGTNFVKGLSGKEMESNNISAMFNTTVASLWTRPSAYVLNNDTGYAAPALKAFYQTENNVEIDVYGRDEYLVEAVTVRLFGIGSSANFRQWGTAANPYLIENELHANNLSAAVNANGRSFEGKYFSVTDDIYFTESFTPIGSVQLSRAFMGNFDGGDHCLHDLEVNTVTGEPDNAGLFGYLNGAAVSDLAISGASVTGVNYVGVVAGRSINSTFKNIMVTASTVSATGYAGGLTGSQNGGSIENVFLDVEMTSAVPNDTIKAVIGITEGTAPSPRTNLWYFTPETIDGEKYLYTSSQFGSRLISETRSDAAFSFTSGEDYAFTFTAEQGTHGNMNLPEFRLADETTISANSYSPPTGVSAAETVYLRFTRKVEVFLSATDSTASQYVFAELNGESFYEGQEVTLTVSGLHSERVNNNFYVESIKPSDVSGVEISETLGAAPYSYDEVNNLLKFVFTMRESVAQVRLNLNSLTKNGEDLTKTYDGQPATYTDAAYVCPSGFSVGFVYGTEGSPRSFKNEAPYTASSSYYAVTVEYYNTYGVRVGSVQSLFRINALALKYNHSADSNVPVIKWGDDPNVNISVRSDDIEGIISNDKVSVSANVVFNDADPSVGDSWYVVYSFELKGDDAGNYSAPSDYSAAVGVVEKRPIYIVPGKLSSVYNAKAPSSGDLGTINISNSVSSRQPSKSDFVYTFTPADGQQSGAAGAYTLEIGLKSASAQFFGEYYEFFLKSSVQAPEVKQLTFNIEPLEIALSVSVKTYVYTGRFIAVTSASALGLGADAFEELKKYVLLFDAEGDRVDKILNAGVYTAAIDAVNAVNEFPALANYVTKTAAFEILKADQRVSVIETADRIRPFGPDENGGGAGFTLAEYFSAASTASADYVYELIYECEGAEITDGILYVSGVGSVTVYATAAGNVNYNQSEPVTCDFTVRRRKVEVRPDYTVVRYGVPAEVTYTVTDLDGKLDIHYAQLGITLDVSIGSGGDDKPGVGVYRLNVLQESAVSEFYAVTVYDSEAMIEIVERAVEIVPVSLGATYGDALTEIAYEIYEYIGDERVQITDISLSGSLGLEAKLTEGYYSVGKYEIDLDSFAARNPYYVMTFAGGAESCEFTVEARKLSVTLSNYTKTFGEPDPVPEYTLSGFAEGHDADTLGIRVSIGRDRGENAVDESGNAVYYYYNISVSGLGADDCVNDIALNYVYVSDPTHSPYLKIEKAVPVMRQTASVSVNAKSATGADLPVPAEAVGVSGEILEGSVMWVYPDAVLDFTDSAVIKVGAVFTPSDLNYSVTEFEVDVDVIPKTVTATFTGAVKYVYSGKQTAEMTYMLSGGDEGDDLMAELVYDGDRINAGSYSVTVVVNNHNYALTGSGKITVEIEPAVITVAFERESYAVDEDEDLEMNLVYTGFVQGEGKEVLRREATFVAIQVPGDYTVTPSGARADNYTFVYVPSELHVYRVQLVDPDSDTLFSGSFPAGVGAALVVEESFSAGNADSLYQSVKGAYAALSDKVLKQVYGIVYDGEENYFYGGTLVVTMNLADSYSEGNAQYLYVTANGEILPVENAKFNDDGTVTFEVSNAAYILLAETDESGFNVMYIYIGAGAAAVVLVLLIVIITFVKRRRKSRYIRYNDE